MTILLGIHILVDKYTTTEVNIEEKPDLYSSSDMRDERIFNFTQKDFTIDNIVKNGNDQDIIYEVVGEPKPYVLPNSLDTAMNRGANNMENAALSTISAWSNMITSPSYYDSDDYKYPYIPRNDTSNVYSPVGVLNFYEGRPYSSNLYGICTEIPNNHVTEHKIESLAELHDLEYSRGMLFIIFPVTSYIPLKIAENGKFKCINYENRVKLDQTSSFTEEQLDLFPYGYCKSDRTLQGSMINIDG